MQMTGMSYCSLSRYSIIILVVECIGITAVIPYAAINVIHTHPTGSPGLPVDDGISLPDKTCVSEPDMQGFQEQQLSHYPYALHILCIKNVDMFRLGASCCPV